MGGSDIQNKRAVLDFKNDVPHVLIATPPMAEAVISRSQSVSLDSVKALVLDEVDLMLSMQNNRPSAQYLLNEAADLGAQIIFVSATITEDAERVGERFMQDPKRVNAAPVSVYDDQISKMPERLDHWFFVLKSQKLDFKLLKLVQLLRALRNQRQFRGPNWPSGPTTLIVFINDPGMITELVDTLRKEYGYQARGLGARSNKQDFSMTLDEIAAGKIDLLIATDVLARGMDIFGITDVVNFDIPRSTNMYLHRAGRAGRMKGKLSHHSHVISFVAPDDIQMVRDDVRSLGDRALRMWISADRLYYGS
eukprot:gnl/TRDRNA2_/TRDRNA2_136367_c1_seq1.p1 gnl/TRDRNA2_/TRDRNA2_136367_c1~~gnl/TRDRNA2_/TRDRNA2_136367_c1_seq1.p1  ORF type:complete len:344 (+),score=57.03 gnl/TRDRNA2_/TRDRNA2_136367_c1_seq1:110-1033(+)